MKELSIEEKAKAYDEALKKVKDMLSYKEVRREDMEYLFPALKESEDERIRKELICYFEKYPSIVIGPFNTKECIAWLEKQSTPQVRTGLEWVNTIDDACDKRYSEEYAHGEYCHEQSFKWGFQEGVDWLEKQGEQKPVEPTDLRTWKYIVDAVLTEREGIGQYLDSPWTTEVAEKLQKRFGNIEQKPVEDVNGEDYGIDGLYAAMDILNKTLGQVEGYQSDDGILEHKAAMTAVKKLYKQKPVELEKEEKSRLMKKCVHRAYQQGYDTGFHMATTELKHKQEWSEEDEKIRSSIIDFIRYELNHSTYIGTAGVDSARQIEWLESLKDRVIPQSHWKPSKEQMDALHYVTNFDYGGHKSTLVSLYEQLKKLK